MNEAAKCTARVSDDWHDSACPRRATQERAGRGVCGTHANVFDRWVRTGRDAVSMAEFWWHWARPESAS